MNIRKWVRGAMTNENLETFFTVLAIAAIAGLMIMAQQYERTHYAHGTYINDVDCSRLTVSEAREKLEQEEVMLAFADGSQLSVPGDQFGRSICDISQFEEFLMKQNEVDRDKPKHFELLGEIYSVDSSIMRECIEYAMKQCVVPTSQKPENAYIRLSDEGYLEIAPEVQGNFIKVEDAVKFASEVVMRGDDFIWFNAVTEIYPEIRTNNEELVLKADKVNKYMKAKIEYTLSDGSVYTLDKEVMKNWIMQDESGEFYIDLEEGIKSFLEGLNQKVQELGATMEFIDREGKVHNLPVEENHRNSVDIEAEKMALKDEIGYGGNIKRDPFYSRFNSMETFTTRAEVNREQQEVYFYLDGEYIAEVDGDPTVTGTKDTKWETPLGVFFVIYMQSPKKFITYGGESEYWVQFTADGIGFHDASGRRPSEFVPETHLKHGSHGCANLLKRTAKVFYENSYEGMPVIVY